MNVTRTVGLGELHQGAEEVGLVAQLGTADVNFSGNVATNDLFTFLRDFFAGC